MHRQVAIFISLLLVLTIGVVAAGYATGTGPLGIISIGMTRVISGETMIPSRTLVKEVACGSFRSMMQVELVNDGPVTILLDSRKQF